MAEFKLSYTAQEIDEKLGKIDDLEVTSISATSDSNGNVTLEAFEISSAQDKGAVRFDIEQSLTPEQQAQARENIGVSGEYYSTNRTPFEDAQTITAEDIYELYRGLGAVENTLRDFKGEETELHEFVFSVGDYNDNAWYWKPDDVHKPTFLVTAGLHAYERTAVLSTYRFFKDLVNGKNLPPYLKEGAIFKVIPVANPWGFDRNYKDTKNNVNLNRNFDWNWEEQLIPTSSTGGAYNLYSGPSVASEVETQAITNWLIANRDAVLFIDMHCAFDTSKFNVGIVGTTIPSVVRAKKIALRGLDNVIPFWRTSRTNGSKGFYYSTFCDGYTVKENGQDVFKKTVGPATYYASDKLGIPAFAMELLSTEKNGVDQLSSNNVAVGAECLGNVLLETYKQLSMDVAAPMKKYSTIVDALSMSNETADGTVVAYEAHSMLNIMLTADIHSSEIIEVTKDCTIHLNGHKLSFADGKHLHLTSGKLTINGTVPGSEISKAIVNGTTENLVKVDGVEGTELHLFGGVYSVTGTASSAIIPFHAGTGKVAKMTLSGCTLNVNCSGLAVYGMQIVDDTTVDNCEFNINDTSANYPVTAFYIMNTTNKLTIRNTIVDVDAKDGVGAQGINTSSNNCVIENCKISSTGTGDVFGIVLPVQNTGSASVNACRIEASGNASKNVYAIKSVAGTEVRINGGQYQGTNKALNLLGAAYINGLAVDGATYTAKEYNFSE